MSVTAYTMLVLIGVLCIYAVFAYNRLVALRNHVQKAWSNIDIVLKQRHDELPKLVAVCREYMRFEQETLERVIAARSRVAEARERRDVDALGAAEGALRTGLGQLFALVESYPSLKANDNFQHLAARITGLEDTIADRREFYNESANTNNIALDLFPDVFIARTFAFTAFKLLSFDRAETEDVDVRALLQS
ncbi:MAG: LemA family protein [Pseudomonadota bacterium]|nr:LemA family protein [Pseudomonadota bacterium]